jgi:hypothetical protein
LDGTVGGNADAQRLQPENSFCNGSGIWDSVTKYVFVFISPEDLSVNANSDGDEDNLKHSRRLENVPSRFAKRSSTTHQQERPKNVTGRLTLNIT